jgi:hypothetical protein
MIKGGVVISLAVLSFNVSLAQNVPVPTIHWKLDPIHLVTRWAKDVSPEHPLPEYPRPQMVRENWENLNGLWQYAIKDSGRESPKQFDGNILVPFSIESTLSGVGKVLLPTQELWYRRFFRNPWPKASDRVLLHFGAVDWQTTVYVNGQEVGKHQGGYLAFSFDITPYLHGDSNELTVKVWDPTDQGPNPHGKQTLNPQNIYYTSSSGIWQTVWLESVPSTYIDAIATTPDIDKGLLHVKVSIVDPNTKVGVLLIATDKGKVISQVGGLTGDEIKLPIKNAKLWSPDHPFLYGLTVKLIGQPGTRDKVQSYFGMRKIAIEKDKGGVPRIFLNNRATYNVAILDQGFWPDGLYTAPTDEALAFDIKAEKAMGFNAIRKHIKVEPARWYYHADKIGMLVWQDFVNPSFNLTETAKTEFEEEVAATVAQLRSEPCITTWVLFNEKWGSYDQQRLTQWVRQMDSSRIIDGHTGEMLFVDGQLRSPSPNAWVAADVTDVHSYPSPMLPPSQPGKGEVLGEFGGIGVPMIGHQWDNLSGWGYINVSGSDLQARYKAMIDTLKLLKEQGLSASVYTQLCDVEQESNGLMTYDRSMVKMPMWKIKDINNELIGSKDLKDIGPAIVFTDEADTVFNERQYKTLLHQYEAGRKDSSFLEKLTLLALRNKDQDRATAIENSLIRGMKDPLSKANVYFICQVTNTSLDLGFSLMMQNLKRIDLILGKNFAVRNIRRIIETETIAQFIIDKNVRPDWDGIEKRVAEKYGAIGQEQIWGDRMIYSLVQSDWDNFGKYYALYFTTASDRSQYHINNMSWAVVEHVTDTAVIRVAIHTMEYDLATFDQLDFGAYDTYANLLYKAGDKSKALEWEEKAFNGMPDNKDISNTLANMKKGMKAD